MKLYAPVVIALSLAACGPVEQGPRPARAAPPVPVPGATVQPVPGAAGPIVGQNGRALIARFGEPQIDVQEGQSRKLQFLSPQCVLDAYLYPPADGRGPPVVRHIDTRLRDGRPAEPNSCIAALTRPGMRVQ